MGKVAIIMKIFPKEAEDYELMKQNVINALNPKNVKDEDLAFGLKALKIMVIRDDKQGAGNIEQEVMKIEGVGQAQIEDLTLV